MGILDSAWNCVTGLASSAKNFASGGPCYKETANNFAAKGHEVFGKANRDLAKVAEQATRDLGKVVENAGQTANGVVDNAGRTANGVVENAGRTTLGVVNHIAGTVVVAICAMIGMFIGAGFEFGFGLIGLVAGAIGGAIGGVAVGVVVLVFMQVAISNASIQIELALNSGESAPACIARVLQACFGNWFAVLWHAVAFCVHRMGLVLNSNGLACAIACLVRVLHVCFGILFTVLPHAPAFCRLTWSFLLRLWNNRIKPALLAKCNTRRAANDRANAAQRVRQPPAAVRTNVAQRLRQQYIRMRQNDQH